MQGYVQGFIVCTIVKKDLLITELQEDKNMFDGTDI